MALHCPWQTRKSRLKQRGGCGHAQRPLLPAETGGSLLNYRAPRPHLPHETSSSASLSHPAHGQKSHRPRDGAKGRSDVPVPTARLPDGWGRQAAKSKADPRRHKPSAPPAGPRRARGSLLWHGVRSEEEAVTAAPAPAARATAVTEQTHAGRLRYTCCVPRASPGLCTGSSAPRAVCTLERTAMRGVRGCFGAWHTV